MGLRGKQVVLAAAMVLTSAPTGAPTSAPRSSTAGGSVEAAATVGAPAAAARPGFTYAVSFGGAAVRWNPCAPIRWTFNPANAAAGGFTTVSAAIARVSRLTRMRFQYVGTTSAAVSSSYLRTGASRPLLIGWSTTSDLLAGAAVTHVGETRMSWVGVHTPAGVRGEYRTGVVAFNARSRAPLTGPGSRYVMALHELGHVVGLGHAGTAQVMSAVLPRGLRDVTAADAQGLFLQGVHLGCLPAV